MKKIKTDPNNLSISEHIKELKNRLLFSVLSFLLFFILNYYYSNFLIEMILKIGKEVGYHFIYLSPQEILIQQIKIAGFFALLCALPIVLFHIMQFIAPVFEIKHVGIKLLFLEFISLFMFCVGLLFSYKLLLPFTLSYLCQLGENTEIIAQISMEKYISFFLTIITCIGMIFEIPLISVILTRFGLLNPKIMKKGRNIAIIAIFIVAAIITPPDIVSQCMVAIPMLLLYEISIWLCIFFHKKK